jgi:hypothetical protein
MRTLMIQGMGGHQLHKMQKRLHKFVNYLPGSIVWPKNWWWITCTLTRKKIVWFFVKMWATGRAARVAHSIKDEPKDQRVTAWDNFTDTWQNSAHCLSCISTGDEWIFFFEPVNREFCIQVPEWLSKLMSRGKQLLLHNADVDSAMIMRCFMALCSVSEISHFMRATFSCHLKWKLPLDEKYFMTLRTLGRMEPPNYMGLPWMPLMTFV